jgi:sugar phosphate permease
MGAIGIALSAILYFRLPAGGPVKRDDDWMKGAAKAFGAVFRNPQSILCGVIAGLLFLPTTVLDMIWGVRFLQEARGFEYEEAVIRSATVPLGWIIGCPLLGAISDRLGRRKPVIIAGAAVLLACVAWVLYGSPGSVPAYIMGLIMGVASGAAMLPYTVVKELNPRELGGTATGVINFITFTLTALLGRAFALGMQFVSGGQQLGLEHYQITFQPMLYGVGLAILLTLLLRETGPAVLFKSGGSR